MTETERKFLVKNTLFINDSTHQYPIVQGFLNRDPERVVRIRISGEKAWITVKGRSDASGTTRFEWEKSIPLEDAKTLLSLCEPGIISKTRYEIPVSNHWFEVDVFEGENHGLILAEVELSTADEAFEKPHWIGKEVTGDNRYYNTCLSRHPFKNW
ncbi:MAG: CYTH domain-containing protein [Flavobacteriaceae bacterium]|nr:CYTH domain-containing protein [Flavobacteriaceae bacterium]